MRFLGIAPLLSLILALMPSVAAAQSNAAPSDPDADSPSGVVYQLPLDRARKDAAPREGRKGGANRQVASSGGGQGTSDPARSTTSIRSENNFGSSSEVPGVSGNKKSDRKDSGSPGASGGGGSGGSGSAGGGSSDGGAAKDLALRATANTVSDGPSDGVVLSLVASLLLVGAAIGVIAGRRTLRRRGI